MTLSRVNVFLTLLMIATSNGNAAEPSNLPQKQVCVTRGMERIVDAKKATRWLVSSFPISANCLDYNDDGDSTHADRVLTLIDDDYAEYLSEGRCTPQDQDSIRNAQQFLISLFASLNKADVSNYRTPYPIRLGAQSHRVHPSELYNSPLPNAEAIDVQDHIVEVYRFLISAESAPEIICMQEPKASKREKEIASPLAGSLLVRGDIKDLKKPLNEGTAKALSAAKFSVLDNREKNSVEFNIAGVVGYKLDGTEIRSSTVAIDFIPYIAVEKRFSQGSDKEEIDNFKFGVDAAGYLRLGERSAHGFDLHPQFTIDSESDTKIGSINLEWEPSFLVVKSVFPNAGFLFDFGTFIPTFSGILNGGYVFEDGENDELKDSETFLRVGANVGLRFIPRSGTIIDQVIPFFGYRYLYGVAGTLNNAERLETGFDFIIPKTQNFSIGLKYTTGQVDETFENVEFIEATVGLKF